jgi:hypothetical protein
VASDPGPKHTFPQRFTAIKFGGGDYVGLTVDPGYGYNAMPYSKLVFATMEGQPTFNINIFDTKIFTEWTFVSKITKDMLARTASFKSTDPRTGVEKTLKVPMFGWYNAGDAHDFPIYEMKPYAHPLPGFNYPPADGKYVGSLAQGNYILFFKHPKKGVYDLHVYLFKANSSPGHDYHTTIAARTYKKGFIKAGLPYDPDLSQLPYTNGVYGGVQEAEELQHIFRIDGSKNTIEDVFVPNP